MVVDSVQPEPTQLRDTTTGNAFGLACLIIAGYMHIVTDAKIDSLLNTKVMEMAMRWDMAGGALLLMLFFLVVSI